MSSWARKMQSVGKSGQPEPTGFLNQDGKGSNGVSHGNEIKKSRRHHAFSNFQGLFLLSFVLQSVALGPVLETHLLSLAVRVWGALTGGQSLVQPAVREDIR